MTQPLGRPQEAVPQEAAEAVIAWIAQGKTLREFCRQPGMPCRQTIDNWKDKDNDFASRIARARETGHDEIADECIEIIDTATDANLGKARVWTRLQLLAKWDPKKYGERTVLAGDPEAPLVLADAIAKARKRVE